MVPLFGRRNKAIYPINQMVAVNPGVKIGEKEDLLGWTQHKRADCPAFSGLDLLVD